MRQDCIDPLAALGRMLWLACLVEPYRGFTLDRCTAALMPPIELGQFRLYSADDGRPLAFVTWALMSAEAEARHRSLAAGGAGSIDGRTDWRSGDRLWFIDFVAPFGHARAVAADLRATCSPTAPRRGCASAATAASGSSAPGDRPASPSRQHLDMATTCGRSDT